MGGGQAVAHVYPHPIAFNVLPHVDSFLDTGYTREEMKMQNEGRKIMHLPDFRASVTCVRVPVYRAHSVAMSAEFERPVSLEAAREVLAKAPGLDLIDEPLSDRYPTPLAAAGKDNCQVGRLRLDCALENGLGLWVSGDQLLKGAALNAVQIAELLLDQASRARGCIPRAPRLVLEQAGCLLRLDRPRPAVFLTSLLLTRRFVFRLLFLLALSAPAAAAEAGSALAERRRLLFGPDAFAVALSCSLCFLGLLRALLARA